MIDQATWGAWSAEWSNCSALCGTGTQTRARSCDYPSCWNGEECEGFEESAGVEEVECHVEGGILCE